jgi:hypothetical protein
LILQVRRKNAARFWFNMSRCVDWAVIFLGNYWKSLILRFGHFHWILHYGHFLAYSAGCGHWAQHLVILYFGYAPIGQSATYGSANNSFA